MRGENDHNDEAYAVRLLHPLREDPPEPSGVDVPRAMAEGRRRRRLRRWSAGVSLTAVTALAAGGGTAAVTALHGGPEPRPAPTRSAPAPAPTAAPAGPAGCTVSRLPTDGIAKAVVTGGDPSGRYLTGRVYPGGGVRTVIWKDGAIVARPPIVGADPTFGDINRSGVAVGSSFDSQNRQHPYVFRDGAVRKLRGGEGDARAINDTGVIVGALGDELAGLPVRWSSAAAAPQRLPLPAGITVGEAQGVLEDGTIVGRVGKSSGQEPSGYLWLPDGTGRAMPLPTVDGRKADYFWPDSIVDGWVIGSAVFDDADTRAFTSMRYHIATNSYERLPVDIGPFAIGAANGWVAGIAGRAPAVIAGSRVVNLPKYPGEKDYELTSFSADGRVAGGYTVSGTANNPLVWRCH